MGVETLCLLLKVGHRELGQQTVSLNEMSGVALTSCTCDKGVADDEDAVSF